MSQDKRPPANVAPVTDETTITELVVTGTLPAALSGRYLRTGPNPVGRSGRDVTQTPPDGMVHAVSLLGGRAVSYRNRWITTDATSRRLGTERVHGPAVVAPDASATNLIAFGRTVVSVDEGALAYEIGPQLETVRRVDLAGNGAGIGAYPPTDPTTGELHVLSAPGSRDCSHHVLSPGGLTRASRTIVGAPRPVRGIALANDRVALFGNGMVGVFDRAGDATIEWCVSGNEEPARPINAHDANGPIAAVMIGPSIELWTADPSTGGLHREVVDPTRYRFARVNERLTGATSRYLYCVGDVSSGSTSLHKLDVAQRTIERRDFGVDRRPGEFVFVTDEQRWGKEDGGWLIGLVHGPTTTDLVVLDAEHITEPAIATIHIPRRIPDGRHGLWVAGR